MNVFAVHQVQDESALCAVISSKDGRWRAVPCSANMPSACRSPGGEWSLGRGQRGVCAYGEKFDVPHHAKENLALQRLLYKLGASAAWLPLQSQFLHWKL